MAIKLCIPYELEEAMKKYNSRHEDDHLIMLSNFIFRFIIRESLVKHF